MLKKQGNRKYKEVAAANFEERMRELKRFVAENEKKETGALPKESETNIDRIFEFLESEAKTAISKDLPGDMYAVSSNIFFSVFSNIFYRQKQRFTIFINEIKA